MIPKSDPTIKQVRNIDNSRLWLPLLTTVFILILIFLFIWVLKGGSLRLYTSVFFYFYHLTSRIWLSVILVGIAQNLCFVPFRLVSLSLSTSLSDFENELAKIKNEKEQYFLFTKKIKQGNPAIIFYILNFILNAIAFLSAGRLFLIDFYSKKLNPKLLYSWVPYPQYPLEGVKFKFPFFKVVDTTALPWSQILLIWLTLVALLLIPRLLWRTVKFLLAKNKKILSFRISYNRLLLKFGSLIGSLFIVSVFILRHIPTTFKLMIFTADLSLYNPTLNLITAVGTFITALHAAYASHRLSLRRARAANIPPSVISRVFKIRIRQSLWNAFLLGLGAFLITSQIPAAFELSVATFELLYIISSYIFNLLLKPSSSPSAPAA